MSNRPQTFNKNHPTHRETFLKFLLLVSLLVAYFIYMSYQYGAGEGLLISVLTWSFFVLCTPIADGGFILAFPIRLLFQVKMVVTQLLTWVLAIVLNLWAFYQAHEIYAKSPVTEILLTIISTPYPYWGILLISALGTFLSIFFGDEMMDVASHDQRAKHHQHGFKYRIVLVVGLGLLTVVAYYQLLSQLHINIPGS
jgi:hypothetical protein